MDGILGEMSSHQSLPQRSRDSTKAMRSVLKRCSTTAVTDVRIGTTHGARWSSNTVFALALMARRFPHIRRVSLGFSRNCSLTRSVIATLLDSLSELEDLTLQYLSVRLVVFDVYHIIVLLFIFSPSLA